MYLNEIEDKLCRKPFSSINFIFFLYYTEKKIKLIELNGFLQSGYHGIFCPQRLPADVELKTKNRCSHIQFVFLIFCDFDIYSVLQPPCCIALMTCMILANEIVHEKAKIDSGCLYGGQVLGSKFFPSQS